MTTGPRRSCLATLAWKRPRRPSARPAALARRSANAWRDSVYLKRNDYAGTALYAGGVPLGPVISTANNNPGQDPNEFLPATRSQHGQGSEWLDAFVYAGGVGPSVASVNRSAKGRPVGTR